MKLRADYYVSGVSVAAVSAAALLYTLEPRVSSAHVIAALLLASLGLASELLTYQLPNGARGSIASIPFAAAALVSSNWAAVVAVGVAILINQVLTRRPLIRVVFNVSQGVLAISVAVIVYRLIGGQGYLEPAIASFEGLLRESGLQSIALLVVSLFVNTVTVSTILSLTGDTSLRDAWKASVTAFSYSIISWPVAILLGWAYVSMGPVWALALSIPILGIRQLYATTIQLRRSNTELLELMVKAIEARDPYTSGHSRRVSQVSTTVARAIGLSEREVERVRIAGLLHDVGKIHEDYAPILRKPGKLTSEEWELMKTHPGRGAELVSTMSHLSDLVDPIRHHHERWDGKGYPAGLAGDTIPLAARIITIADTLDALTSDRPYRNGLSEAEVRAEFIRCRGTQFDPEIIDRVLNGSVWPSLFEKEPTTAPGLRLRRVL
jgi:putative nucleotidyltransferase with HDIG domain